MPNSLPTGSARQSDNRLLAIALLKFLEDLLGSAVSAAVKDAVHEAADNLAQRPLVYSADQAARVLSVSRRTVETWVADGILPRMPHTKRLLIPRVAIESWVNDAARGR